MQCRCSLSRRLKAVERERDDLQRRVTAGIMPRAASLELVDGYRALPAPTRPVVPYKRAGERHSAGAKDDGVHVQTRGFRTLSADGVERADGDGDAMHLLTPEAQLSARSSCDTCLPDDVLCDHAPTT